MPDLEGLIIEVSTNATQAEGGLKALASSLEKIKTIVSGGLGLRRVVSELSKTAEETDKISGEAVSKLERMGAALENISKLNGIKISASLGTQLGRIANSTKEFEGVDFSSLANLTTQLKEIAAVGNSQGFQNVSSALAKNITLPATPTAQPAVGGTPSVNLNGVTQVREKLEEVSGAANRARREIRAAAGEVGKTATKWDNLKSSIRAATKGFSQHISALGRIAEYRLIRTALKLVADAFKTGINNIYYYSQVVGTEFASQMDAAKSSLTTFKNSIGAAVAPLVSSLIPVLQTVCGWLVTFNNLLAHFFAAISGKSTYSAAIAYTDKYGESLGGAGSAAKALRDYTAGFDELNVFKPDTDTGGGGGGALQDFKDMFEEREVTQKLKEHMRLLQDAALGVGAALLGWVVASRFTKSLKKIGGVMLTIAGLAVGIRGSIDAWKNGVDWDNLIELLSGTALVAAGLGLAFGKVAAAVGLLIGGVAMLVIGIRDWIKQGALSTQTFWLLEGAIVAVGVGLSLLTGSLIPLAVAAIVGIGLAIYQYWGEIEEWFNTHVVEPVSEGWANLKKKVSEKWDGIKTWFEENVAPWFTLARWKQLGEDAMEGLKKKINEKVEKIKTDWGTFTGTIQTKWDETIKDIKNNPVVCAITNNASALWNTFKGWWNTYAAPGVNAAVSLLRRNWSTLQSWVGDTVNAYVSLFRNGWSSLTAWVGNTVSVYVSLLRNGWNNITSWIGNSVSVTISLVRGWWGSLKSWLGFSSGGSIGASGRIKYYAGGGAISPTGKSSWWNSVNKYGNGTDSARGTMFVAGEAGPEIVGHVNGRTEVLNKSQLASTMKIAVIEGLARFANYWRSVTSQMAVSTNGIISAVATYSLSAADLNRISQQVMARQVDGAAIVSELERRTSTVDSGQIAEGIASGVSGGNLELIGAIYAMADRVVAAVEESSGDVRIGDDVIGRSYDRYTQKRGLPVNKGAFANAY